MSHGMAAITRGHLRSWARANLDDEFEGNLPPAIAYALAEHGQTYARFLVSVRDGGKNIFVAKEAILVLLRATRSCVKQLRRTDLLVRSGLDYKTWRGRLECACANLGVEPALLAKMSPSFVSIRLC